MASPVRLLRPATNCLRRRPPVHHARYSTTTPSPFAPRHFLSIADLTPHELTALIRNAHAHKTAVKSGQLPAALRNALLGETLALVFTKRSTRTRVSLESGIARLGGHPMFLSSQDIQLGVNESLYDTSVVISSMVAAIVARVDRHAQVADLAKQSSVPVINALCDRFHPLQTLADYLTVLEAFPEAGRGRGTGGAGSLGLEGLKIAWVGDANNVLFDLAIGAAKLGVELSVATPPAHAIPPHMKRIIAAASPHTPDPLAFLSETTVPEEAVRRADIIVTDTWVSMGQEAEKAARLREFEGFQVTRALAERGGAKEGWKFMHCLPRKPEEVSDDVFYSPQSLVFREAENRLWTSIAALEAFVVNKGKIV